MSNKILCLFIHFFDKSSAFEGKSKFQAKEVRNEIITRALTNLQSINGINVVVCGYKNLALTNIDVDLSKYTDQPQHLIYEALGQLKYFRNEYDYFMVVEDDILVGPDILNNTYQFDSCFDTTQIILPNRVEIHNEKIYCIDTKILPGLTGDKVEFNKRKLAVYKNPHSGMLLVNRDKLDYLLNQVDPTYRGKFIGGYMASAFAHYHRPFRLYRVADGYDYHTVQHLDHYIIPKHNPVHQFKASLARSLTKFKQFSHG
jgi:hypothetical protein